MLIEKLLAISENYKDIKKFEAQCPTILLNLREITLKIILKLKHLYKFKNEEYLQLIKKEHKQVPQVNFFFEMQCG